MQLMQMNYFLDKGVLKFDAATAKLRIDYDRYHEAVRDLLKQVLAIQESGTGGDAFIARWGTWDEQLHGRIAANIRAQQKTRYRLFDYAAMGGR
jgi:hypothetical protein